MIQLFDRYGQESRDLHESLEVAGLSHVTVVIEPDGFLPDGILSPFTYYLGYESGKALYFNQVAVPEFWEIAGNNQSAHILKDSRERGVIHYVEAPQARLVKQVDWKDLSGRIYQADHYNRYGACFAKTTYSADGQTILTKYQDAKGQEIVLENHVTGDILLTLPGQALRHFKNRVEFTIFFLQDLGIDTRHLLFNTLATSFLVSYHYPDKSGRDILVWQEPLDDCLPGNMQLLLEQEGLRAKQILIPDKATYEQALALTNPAYHDKFVHLGYHYQFKRENFVRPDALIVTNSDQIEHIETLIESLPMVTFRIAAVTEMSSKLLTLLSYPNVVLYQNASPQKIRELYQLSDLYLDINYGNELLDAVRQAFEHNMLILAFDQTAHNRPYTAPEHLFNVQTVGDMIAKIQEALSSLDKMGQALGHQGRHANYVDLATYQERMERIIGEGHD